ncbi:Fic family protein [Polaribacter gangjinensis]|uniref:Addiction module protein n=1 Tax=Polaribacter gangjinensis TaxID=574710 RepID=A0A2S7WA47_9FLAO|nr:Fic family protein [Polaribacter gangjinensis]PQJ74286.1 addiction module protein [Polaribacter gangjinensis]
MNESNIHHSSFIIENLPPKIDSESVTILKQLNRASRALGQLKGEVSKIPNSQILLDTLTLQEAKDSNEIENIVTTDDEMYQASIDETVASVTAKEALNYSKAIKLGLEIVRNKGLLTVNDIKRIQELISPNHPIRKIPGTVLKNPKTQEVVYTPPQHYYEIQSLLDNLERYINVPDFHDIDALIKMPIIHFQFESIHPFLDGNGRTGRLLNILYLVQQGLLDIPVLYLSSYIIKNKSDYYRLLQEVRTKGSWEEWIVWMLKGVELTAKETIVVVNKIKLLMDDYKKEIRSNYSFYSHDLINILFKHPYSKISFLEKELRVHRHTATLYLNELAKAKMLTKVKIGRSNYYINEPLLKILKER